MEPPQEQGPCQVLASALSPDPSMGLAHSRHSVSTCGMNRTRVLGFSNDEGNRETQSFLRSMTALHSCPESPLLPLFPFLPPLPPPVSTPRAPAPEACLQRFFLTPRRGVNKKSCLRSTGSPLAPLSRGFPPYTQSRLPSFVGVPPEQTRLVGVAEDLGGLGVRQTWGHSGQLCN